MTFFPIIERELRVRARARGTYWLRVAVGLISLLIALPPFAVSSPLVALSTLGKSVSTNIFTAGFILSCCACFLTISSIHREQREGTLVLLLLTRVRFFDALLGKLGAVGFTGLSALVAFSPVLMLPVLVGGVTGGEAARQALVLLDTTVLSIAALGWLSLDFGYRARSQAVAVCWSVVIARGTPLLLSWASYLIIFPLVRKFSGWFFPWGAAYSIIPTLDILCFLGMILVAHRRLAKEVSRAESRSLGESIQDTVEILSRALRKGRAWPPPLK